MEQEPPDEHKAYSNNRFQSRRIHRHLFAQFSVANGYKEIS
jgi:hypothetical protein